MCIKHMIDTLANFRKFVWVKLWRRLLDRKYIFVTIEHRHRRQTAKKKLLLRYWSILNELIAVGSSYHVLCSYSPRYPFRHNRFTCHRDSFLFQLNYNERYDYITNNMTRIMNSLILRLYNYNILIKTIKKWD